MIRRCVLELWRRLLLVIVISSIVVIELRDVTMTKSECRITEGMTKPGKPRSAGQRGSARKQRAFVDPNGRPMARCDRLVCRYGNQCARAIGTRDCPSWS